MEEAESIASVNRVDMTFEIDYMKKLAVVHKCVMLLFMRDRNSLSLVRKIRPELSRIYVSNEFKDVTRLITKSSSTEQHGIDIVITDVDHTTQRLLELLNRRKSSDETRRLPCIPVIILMPVNVDEDIKTNVLNTGGYDVLLQQPVNPKQLFASVLHLLYRRTLVEGAYSGLRKQHISTKYPHLQIFASEKTAQKTTPGDGEDDEEEDDDEDEEEDEEDEEEDDAIAITDNRRSTTFDVEVDDNMSTTELHPAAINELRATYSKTVKRRNFTMKSSMLAGARDPKANQHLDKHIVKSILKGTAAKDDSDSDDEQGTRATQIGVERSINSETEPKRPTRRQAQMTAAAVTGTKVRNKEFYRSDSCNIVDDSLKPKFKPSAAIAEGSTASVDGADSGGAMFGADLMPFVDKPRPDMSKPKSVGGMNRKSTMACWKVLRAQHKFGPGHVEHKHDRPWNNNATKKKLQTSLNTDGTLKLSSAAKIIRPESARPHSSSDDHNVPVEVIWTPPTRFIAAGRTRRRYETELAQTKKRLKAMAFSAESGTGSPTKGKSKIPGTHTAATDSKPGVAQQAKRHAIIKVSPGARTAAVAENAKAEEKTDSSESSIPPTPMSTPTPSQRLKVVSQWRGIAEDDTYDANGEKTKGSLKKLPAMLRAAGGVQFGNMIIGAKARTKARRLVRDMANSALRDPDTSKLIPVTFENRRIGNAEREHLYVGINYEKQGHLNLAHKAFSKALVTCKQVHLIHICRGNVQFQRGKFFSAINDYNNALKQMEVSEDMLNMHLSDVTIARYNRAMALFRIGDDEKGIEDLKFAVMCDPENDSIRETLVMAHRRCSQYEDAIEHCTILHKHTKQKREKEETEKLQESTISLLAMREGNSTSDHIKAISQVGAKSQSKSNGPTVRPHTSGGSMSARAPTMRPGTSPSTGRGGGGGDAGLAASPGGSTQNSSAPPISLLNSRFMSESFMSASGTMDQSGETKHIPRVDIKEHHFPTMKDMKESYQKKRLNEEVAQATLHLDNFKHANGFKRHLFDTLFVRLSPLQDALVTPCGQRTQEQLRLIANVLRSFPALSQNSEIELYDLASCAEYRTVTTKSTIFYQEDPVNGMLLVLSGQLQLRLESGQETKTLATIEPNQSYGELALLFRDKCSQFVEKLHKSCISGKLSEIHAEDPAIGDDDSISRSEQQSLDDDAPPLPRSLQPGTFMSCKVASPSEMILIHSSDFDRMLHDQCEKEFIRHLEVIRSSGIFAEDLFNSQELVRLTRMSVVRRYHQGVTIIEQGTEPEFLYFVLKGICKVVKRPDPTEYVVRRLAELKEVAQTFDQKYAFHHKLRGRFTPASEECRKNHPDIPHMTAAEEEREATRLELNKLEVQVKRVKAAEEKRREEEEELKRLGRAVPNMFVEIATLNWPQIFGEAAVLYPEGGTCLGTIKAETACEILCIHKVHLQTFQIDERLLDRVKQRAVKYPPDQKLVRMLESNHEWAAYKTEVMEEIPKDKWPTKGKSRS